MEEVYSKSEFPESIFEKKDLIEEFSSHMVCYIVINNFFVSLQISDGSYSLSQNTLRLNKRVQEMNPIFHGKSN